MQQTKKQITIPFSRVPKWTFEFTGGTKWPTRVKARRAVLLTPRLEQTVSSCATVASKCRSKLATLSNTLLLSDTLGGGAHSRWWPQDEHPDGSPLFVRVLGTSLRPGGTQGGIIHPPREAGLGLFGTRSVANQSSGRGGGGRCVTKAKR